jgi:hypothetical protein
MAPRFLKQIARDMLDDELIVGDIAVQGADDVIAVAPGLGDLDRANGAPSARRSAVNRAVARRRA